MRLTVLFGPPAVGKLTVARELVALTGAKLFHNHFVVDTLTSVFDFGSEPFVRLREQMWLDVFSAAAAEGQDLVFTFAPETTVQPGFVERARAAVEPARRDREQLAAWGDKQRTLSQRPGRARYAVRTVRGTCGTAEAGTRTQYVQYAGPWGQAALRLRYVPNAGGGCA